MDYLTEEKPDGITAAYEFEKMRLRYPDNIVKGQLNLLDSHDVPRFLSMCHGDVYKRQDSYGKSEAIMIPPKGTGPLLKQRL